VLRVGTVAVAMKSDCRKSVDLCPSDGLACSCLVESVGFGLCVKGFRGVVRVCCRFSDVSGFESSISGARAKQVRQDLLSDDRYPMK
jgi:hypothetical protein